MWLGLIKIVIYAGLFSPRMAEKGTSHVEVDKDLRGCALLLKSVACEWILLFFLLIDAVFLFILTKFAKYCDLPLPCMLCSRLDHTLGNKKPEFYKDLICDGHRSKFSSLVFCHIHGKLADVKDVCEECLLSFATKKDSSPEMHKFLIGKLGLDSLSISNPVSEMDFYHGFVSTKSCSCCKKQWKCRPIVQKLMRPKPDSNSLSSSPREKGTSRRDAKNLKPDSDSTSATGYPSLRISSDSECDLQFAEDEDYVFQPERKFSFKARVEDRSASKNVSSPSHRRSPSTPKPWLHQHKTDFKVNGDGDTQEGGETRVRIRNEGIEGDSIIAELRKQIDEDKEFINRLRKELEEERNASAEAANQAVAMIAKLQEEKSVLNMDAQQYLRMMEEQAEHDMDALERSNDLLVEKEKEIQDLEAELEFYRLKYPDEYEEEFAHASLISQDFDGRKDGT